MSTLILPSVRILANKRVLGAHTLCEMWMELWGGDMWGPYTDHEPVEIVFKIKFTPDPPKAIETRPAYNRLLGPSEEASDEDCF